MRINILQAVTCLLYFPSTVFAKEETNLLLVQILFRHGDRSPIKLYPNDPNPESVWPEGLGQLTLIGRKQHYALGKYLRSMYANFTTSSPLEVQVNSSEDDRCLESAAANLASFYAPEGMWVFEETLNWQPIPIHYVSKRKDKILETMSDCPQATQELRRLVNSPEGQKIIAKHKEMFKYLSFHSGNPIVNWTIASYLHDVMFTERKYNLTIPSWVEPYWDELAHVSNLTFYWDYSSPLIHRLRAGPFLQKITENMQKKLNGDIPKLKFYLYSSHDTNIAVVLNALKVFNMMKPPFCATLLFELHENTTDGVKAVRLLYQNSSDVEKDIQAPHVLILKGCTEFCPFEFFVKYIQHLIPQDWEKECQLDESDQKRMKEKQVIGWTVIVAVAVTVAVILYALGRTLKNKASEII